ncbi:hypothetical protein PC129_g20391 [Phytophthora cactorum]|uniref:Uncharacterized protein n=1 Tax=Phytophthora cactorum TaxID=29920 RepID=A0A8T1H938_9STRA|nr:hypothetical protein PC114_g23302 [Phytophthora cactorum]KAG3193750.1 hypothetical protein PC128_g9942 [Phytophthora cactorum]KAG3208587.1 hypothetical protein PC129_g20391 [Phytophthora cactorum]
MAFLQEEDDASVFEAALSFVDECSLDCLGPSTEILAASAVSELPPFKSEQCHAVFGGPSFAIDCREAATMVPLNMKSLLNDAIAPDLRLSLPPSNETMTRPKTTKAKKMATGLSVLLRKRLTQQGVECLRGKGSHTIERRTAQQRI